MITIKEALAVIKHAVIDLFGDDVQDIRLEEMESNSHNNTYKLTISFLVPNKNVSSMASVVNALTSPYIRQYKSVTINCETSEIVSIKIHKNE